MKLQRFVKNKKERNIVIASVLGLFLIIGGVYLFRTFALYEEKKTFDVIFGKVPPFTKKENDLELAILVDGEKRTEIPEGKDYQVNVTCEDEALTGTWDYSTWKLKIEGSFTQSTTCSISFDSKEAKYNIKVDGVTQETFPEKGEYKVEISCDNAKNYSWDEEKWEPIVSDFDQTKETTCNVAFSSLRTLYANVEIGDYVSYTPSSTSYEISAESTGYESNQTINPSELNLWRVINKNDDGTIEMVSEYTSSKYIYFQGKEGYRRFVGTLNTIASAYETEAITSYSRYVGGTEEQEICSSYDKCSDEKTTINKDTPDTILIKEAIGTMQTAQIANKTGSEYYWLASRYYNGNIFSGYIVSTVGGLSSLRLIKSDSSDDLNKGYLRPIVTLKSGLSATELEDKTDTNQNKTFKQWKVN